MKPELPAEFERRRPRGRGWRLLSALGGPPAHFRRLPPAPDETPEKRRRNRILDAVIVVCLVVNVGSRLLQPRTVRPAPPTLSVGVQGYGERWPFTFDRGVLTCHATHEVRIRDPQSGADYPLTQAAVRPGWDTYHAALRPGASDETVRNLIARGLKLCASGRP